MTRDEGVQHILDRFHIRAKVIDVETYAPDPHDVEICEAITGRTLAEEDFWFNVDAEGLAWYTLRQVKNYER